MKPREQFLDRDILRRMARFTPTFISRWSTTTLPCGGKPYNVTNDALPDTRMQRMRCAVERLNTYALRKKIASLAPDAIICTHFLPAELLSRMLQARHRTRAIASQFFTSMRITVSWPSMVSGPCLMVSLPASLSIFLISPLDISMVA